MTPSAPHSYLLLSCILPPFGDTHHPTTILVVKMFPARKQPCIWGQAQWTLSTALELQEPDSPAAKADQPHKIKSKTGLWVWRGWCGKELQSGPPHMAPGFQSDLCSTGRSYPMPPTECLAERGPGGTKRFLLPIESYSHETSSALGFGKLPHPSLLCQQLGSKIKSPLKGRAWKP